MFYDVNQIWETHLNFIENGLKSKSEEIQSRIRRLQNREDCDEAPTLICLADFCGYGCQMHFLTYCLIKAYYWNRTLIYESSQLESMPKGLYEGLEPFGKCTNTNRTSMLISNSFN